jgi:hypothetical protein
MQQAAQSRGITGRQRRRPRLRRREYLSFVAGHGSLSHA